MKLKDINVPKEELKRAENDDELKKKDLYNELWSISDYLRVVCSNND